jgi:hypothetical protein
MIRDWNKLVTSTVLMTSHVVFMTWGTLSIELPLCVCVCVYIYIYVCVYVCNRLFFKP